MLRLSERSLEAIRRSYKKYPVFFAYLYYDVFHEPEVAEVPYINTAGDFVRGYVLVYWRPRQCPAVHIVGDVDSARLPDVDCMTVHLETWRQVELPDGAERTPALTMTCGEDCRERARDILARGSWSVRRSSREDYRRLTSPADAEYLSPRCDVYGVYESGVLISAAAVCVHLPEVWLVSGVYTAPQFRGRGAATYLTAYITELATSNGALAALSVAEENAAAVRVYKKIGYRAVRSFWLVTVDRRRAATSSSHPPYINPGVRYLMGQRVLEIQLLNRRETQRKVQVDGSRPIGDVVREYLKEVNAQLNDYSIAVETPRDLVTVDESMSVDRVIRELGSDRVLVIPNVVFGY